MSLPAPRRILVIMLRRVGDVILTTPAVRALRKLHPAAELDFLVEPPCHEVLHGNPDLTRVLLYGSAPANYLYWLFRVNRAGYDWVIDFMGNPRTAALTAASRAPVRAGPGHVSHRWAYTHPMTQSADRARYSALEKILMLRSLGLDADAGDYLPRMSADPDSEEFANAATRRLRLPGGLLVGLVPASRRETRRWPAARYAALGRLLRDKLGARLLVFWGPGEEALAREVRDGIGTAAHLSPETRSIRQLAALIGRCGLVVTNCSGPRHIATARSVPTVTVHGSSDPAAWNPPDSPLHAVVRREELACIGCRSNSCPTQLECLRDLEAERVFAACEKVLSLTARPS
ncbi:MAG: glycosyltransferase family 9 protein [Elusimicrobia bacterium]|nr:glycosyltransferase family 9 protein [Elusimicrobiota bacterium]